MAILKTDLSVAANGDIRSVAGTTSHRVIELHRFLMDLFDDTTGTADDLLDVTNEIIPSSRSTDQIITLNSPYNVDDILVQRFFDGSIDQLDGGTQYSGCQVGGSTNLGTSELVLIQNNAVLPSHWGTGKNPDVAKNLILQILVKSRDAGVDIDGKRLRVVARELGDTYAESSITLGQSNAIAFIQTLPDDFNLKNDATIAALVGITNVEGYQLLDLNNGNGSQPYYSKWTKAANTTNDLYEWAKRFVKRGTALSLFGMNGILFRGVTHEIDIDTVSVTDFASVETLSWGAGTTAGTARMLAIDDVNAGTKMWVQLLTGAVPTDNLTITGATSGATALVNVNVISRPISPTFLGTFTGSISSGYGVGILPADLVSTDKLRDLLNASQVPPNNVSVAVTSIVSGQPIFVSETRTNVHTVLGVNSVGATTIVLNSTVEVNNPQPGRIKIAGTDHVYLSYAASTVTLAGSGLKSPTVGGEQADLTSLLTDKYNTITQVTGLGTLTVQEVIAQAHPSAGFVRVFNSAQGNFDKLQYSSFTGSVFTLVGVTPRAYTVGDDAYVPFIDEVSTGTSISKTIVYPGSVIPARMRAYDSANNKKPFEVGITITSTGSSTAAIMADDA